MKHVYEGELSEDGTLQINTYDPLPTGTVELTVSRPGTTSMTPTRTFQPEQDGIAAKARLLLFGRVPTLVGPVSVTLEQLEGNDE